MSNSWQAMMKAYERKGKRVIKKERKRGKK